MHRILYLLLFFTSSSVFAQTEEPLRPVTSTDSERFGGSVSIDGNFAIVGAKLAAYIFEFDGDTWIQRDKLTINEGAMSDDFGGSVSIDGNFAIVGASLDNEKGDKSGAAYIFERQGSSWIQVAKLTAGDGVEEDRFGFSVSISGDFAIVGAWAHNANDKSDSGAAYIFERQGNSWIEVKKLTVNDGEVDDQFGFNVSISDNVAIVSSWLDDDVVKGVDSGSAYIFEQQGSSWNEVKKLTAQSAAAGDWFGERVSISGDVAIVGSRFNDENEEDSGAAYIFERQGSTWNEVEKLAASDTKKGDLLGLSVAIDGNFAIVGAVGSDGNVENSGSAYLFERQGSSWNEVKKLMASNGADGDQFGFSVSISGDVALVGSWLKNVNGVTESGFAYSYGPETPFISSTAVTSGFTGTQYTYQLSADGFPRPSFSLSAAPVGMLIDSQNGLITWTPSSTGQFNVTAVASNSGGSDEQSFTITVTNDLSAPIITSSAITSATVNQAYEYTVMASGNPEPTFSLVAPPPGMSINAATGVVSWLPANPGRFEVTVVASNGVNSQDSQSFTIIVADAPVTISRNESFVNYELATSYQLLSIPGDVDLNIGATLVGTPGTDWNAFLDNGAEVDFLQPYLSNSDFRFRPGRGFWILSKTDWEVSESTVSPVPLDENGRFTLNTHAGWNIISSPFPGPVSWDAVKEASNLVPTSSLFAYNGRSFQQATELEAYSAYYFDSDGSTLSIPHPSYQASGKTEDLPALPSLTLRVTNNEGMQGTAQIVLHDDALSGQDALDQRAPRDDFSPLSLGFTIDTETVYATDARPEIAEGSSFDLVINSESDSEMAIEFTGTELFEGLSLALIDKATSQFIDIHLGSSVVLNSPKGTYRLLVGPDTYLEDQRTTLKPQETVLRQNYPNPFKGETTLSYSLTEASPVEIQVYDILGRSVVTLVAGSQDAGQHQVVWNGHDQQDNDVRPGLYFIQLQTDSGERSVIKAVKLD